MDAKTKKVSQISQLSEGTVGDNTLFIPPDTHGVRFSVQEVLIALCKVRL